MTKRVRSAKAPAVQQLRDSVLAIAARDRALTAAAPVWREERVTDEDLPFIPDSPWSS